MAKALYVLAICYNVWMLLIFAYAKFDGIVNNSATLSALQSRIEGVLSK